MASFDLIKDFTLKKEGGLSRAKTDSASKYPAPCTHAGYSDWHTNKGITWQTFKTVAEKLGVKPSCEAFINMTDKTWTLISKRIYWDVWNLDKFKSQGIANLIFQSGYGSGINGALKMWNKFFNTNFTKATELTEYLEPLIKTKAKELSMFNKMWEYRLKWLLSLPGQQANYKGWENRMKDLKALSLEQMKKKKQ
jgi:Predicted lysozyme (DUF847).